MHPQSAYPEDIQALARADLETALAEDVGPGDLTASLVPDGQAVARITARESAVVCGAPWVNAAVLALDPDARIDWFVSDGQRCAPGQVVVEIRGAARALLSAERTALNFLQLLSGVASKTASYVDAVAGTGAQIVDTRKTVPGLRRAQKYAVRMGGGGNHRMGLYDAVLVKENHIAAAGGIAAVMAKAADVAAKATFVQVEVENLDELRQALDAGARMILLDNMAPDALRAAVRINAERGEPHRAQLEISGGVTLETVRAMAETGVDRISVGALTKDVKAIDFSMRFEALA
jgi:nicotinate-nucleotide pyrophosphorylase (carboxylating)